MTSFTDFSSVAPLSFDTLDLTGRAKSGFMFTVGLIQRLLEFEHRKEREHTKVLLVKHRPLL